MAGSYEIWLTNDKGERIDQLTTTLGFSASKVTNGIGYFSMILPPSFDTSLISPDRMVQIWRAPRGGTLGLWHVYFLRRWLFEETQTGERVTIGGPDINDLLRRRIVAAFTNSAQAKKSDAADDMMKEIVTEALADGIAPTPDEGTRVWDNLSIQGDQSDGPTITKSFAFDKLLTPSGQGILPEIAQAAKIEGTEIFFSISPNDVAGNSITFQFRTTINQPGLDVSDRILFDQRLSNMAFPKLEYDHTEEENYIYAAGQGEKSDRNVQQVADSSRYNASIWNRCEAAADARNQSADAEVQQVGQARLKAGEPKIKFTANLIDTAGTRFGTDWDFGYKVRTKYRSIEFDSIIRRVAITINENGSESIDSRLEFES